MNSNCYKILDVTVGCLEYCCVEWCILVFFNLQHWRWPHELPKHVGGHHAINLICCICWYFELNWICTEIPRCLQWSRNFRLDTIKLVKMWNEQCRKNVFFSLPYWNGVVVTRKGVVPVKCFAFPFILLPSGASRLNASLVLLSFLYTPSWDMLKNFLNSIVQLYLYSDVS
jgi:hypothetical protein